MEEEGGMLGVQMVSSPVDMEQGSIGVFQQHYACSVPPAQNPPLQWISQQLTLTESLSWLSFLFRKKKREDERENKRGRENKRENENKRTRETWEERKLSLLSSLHFPFCSLKLHLFTAGRRERTREGTREGGGGFRLFIRAYLDSSIFLTREKSAQIQVNETICLHIGLFRTAGLVLTTSESIVREVRPFTIGTRLSVSGPGPDFRDSYQSGTLDNITLQIKSPSTSARCRSIRKISISGSPEEVDSSWRRHQSDRRVVIEKEDSSWRRQQSDRRVVIEKEDSSWRRQQSDRRVVIEKEDSSWRRLGGQYGTRIGKNPCHSDQKNLKTSKTTTSATPNHSCPG
ncbi:uncharacterized protein LOC118942023 [Oncorhynchus mykiss]|uniref:uncharacterized protein LOC118942023 n=1 Tax=Oncorhynchus mykiss TaxID=8022 RepID=UPI001878EAD6|nr:uncharacterized protein LOC118942023 [Oncorhynchus mykiss]